LWRESGKSGEGLEKTGESLEKRREFGKCGESLEKTGESLEKTGESLEKRRESGNCGESLEKTGESLEKSGGSLEKIGESLEKLERVWKKLDGVWKTVERVWKKSGESLEKSQFCSKYDSLEIFYIFEFLHLTIYCCSDWQSKTVIVKHFHKKIHTWSENVVPRVSDGVIFNI
jgi:hypothetical protein